MYFQKASEGQNQFWRYAVTVLLVIVFSQVLGSIPILLAFLFRGFTAAGPSATANPLDFASRGINPNVGLLLIIFPFAMGLIGLWTGIRFIHNKPFKAVLTGYENVRVNRILQGFLLWFLLMGVSLIVHLLIEKESFVLQFSPVLFLQLILVAFLFLPLQTSFEEILFRGYFMQGFGLLFRNRWLPLLVTSLIFGLLHFFNPEVKEFGFWLTMPQYIGWGLFLGLLVVLDGGLELPLGIHAANNIFISLFVTHKSSALQTPSLFRVTSINPAYDMVEFFLMTVLFLILAQWLYRWNSWKKLTGSI
jgi:membrane protease YdiL (CAAX protease family)